MAGLGRKLAAAVLVGLFYAALSLPAVFLVLWLRRGMLLSVLLSGVYAVVLETMVWRGVYAISNVRTPDWADPSLWDAAGAYLPLVPGFVSSVADTAEITAQDLFFSGADLAGSDGLRCRDRPLPAADPVGLETAGGVTMKRTLTQTALEFCKLRGTGLWLVALLSGMAAIFLSLYLVVADRAPPTRSRSSQAISSPTPKANCFPALPSFCWGR